MTHCSGLDIRPAHGAAERGAAWQWMQHGNRAAQAMYNGASLARWLQFSDPAQAWTYSLYLQGDDGVYQPAAVVVLNGFSGHSAYIHFCVAAGFEVRFVDMGRAVVDWLLNSALTTLCGLTPATYRHVLRSVARMGFERQGIIPDACFLAKQQRHVAGIMTVCTRTTFEGALVCG